VAWSTSPRHGTNWHPSGYRKTRLAIFAEHDHRCLDCQYQFTANHLELDHVDGNRNNWDRTNLGPRCHPCHDAKTQREAQAARRQQSARRAPEQHPGLRGGG